MSVPPVDDYYPIIDPYNGNVTYGSSGGGGYIVMGGGGGGGYVPLMQAPPSWAVGTFYGIRGNGERITLTINSDGSISGTNVSSAQVIPFTGTYHDSVLDINGGLSNIVQTVIGLNTVVTTTGETINYSRGGFPVDPVSTINNGNTIITNGTSNSTSNGVSSTPVPVNNISAAPVAASTDLMTWAQENPLLVALAVSGIAYILLKGK